MAQHVKTYEGRDFPAALTNSPCLFKDIVAMLSFRRWISVSSSLASEAFERSEVTSAVNKLSCAFKFTASSP